MRTIPFLLNRDEQLRTRVFFKFSTLSRLLPPSAAIKFALDLLLLLSDAFDKGNKKSVLQMYCRSDQRFQVVYCEQQANTNTKMMSVRVKTSQCGFENGSLMETLFALFSSKFNQRLLKTQQCVYFFFFFFYISQNFIMACFAAFERSKLHQILTTASISPQCLTYAFGSFSLSLCFVFTDFKFPWLIRYFITKCSSSVYCSSFFCSY